MITSTQAQAATYIETWDINDISGFYVNTLGYKTCVEVQAAYESHKTAFKKLTAEGYLIEEIKTLAKSDIQDCEVVKPVKVRKSKTVVKAIQAQEEKANVLYTFIEYPFKSGHMECVNRYTDTWEPTRKHNNMVNTVNKKIGLLYDELENIFVGKGYKEADVYDQLVADGFCGDEVIDIIEEWAI